MIGIDDPETIVRPLANQLRPTIISSWMEKKKALLTNNAERMKSLLDNLQKKLDEVGLLKFHFFFFGLHLLLFCLYVAFFSSFSQ